MSSCAVLSQTWWGIAAVVAMLPAVSVGAAMPTGSDAGVPLPPGIPAWREPTTVELGASTLKVYSAMTTIPEAELIEFYQQTLPQTGWHLERLPWQAQQDVVAERLQKAVKEHGDSSDSDGMKQMLGEFQQARQSMQRQIYASRGAEHVIVNLWPMGGQEKSTAIFINRWRGSQTWLEDSMPPAQQGIGIGGGNSWPQTNVCCSGQTVPGMNVLPFLIPWYPAAKAVARSTAPDGTTTVILMTPDAAESVGAFYRAQMPPSGWKLTGDDGPSGSGRLSFQKPDRTCVLTIQGGTPGENGTAVQTMITLVASVRASNRTSP